MYRLDLNAAPDGMLLVDEGGQILFANDRAEQIFAARGGGLVGAPIESLIPARHRHGHTQHRAGYTVRPEARRMGSRGPLLGLRNDGAEFPVDVSLSPLADGDRKLVVVAIRDVSHRAEADRTARLQSAALESAANGIVITDRQGIITWVNPALLRMTGYEREELIGETPRVLNAGVHDKNFFDGLWHTILAGKVWRGETTNKRKDGTLYIEEQTITPVGGESGEPEFFVAIKQDVSERKRAVMALERRVEELSLLHQVATAGVHESTQGGFVQRVAKLVSEARYRESFRIGLIDRPGAVLKLWRIRADQDERDVLMIPLPHVARELARLDGGLSRAAFRFGMGDEAEGLVSHLWAPLRAQHRVVGMVGVGASTVGAFDEGDERLLEILAANVSASVERLRLFLAVERLALTDSLTGLHNRRRLHERGRGEIERARRHGRPLSLIMLDIDEFKSVNDTYGHAVGDQVIQMIARACRASVRASDVCTRTGGDEFVVLLPDSEQPGAVQIAQRLRATVQDSTVPGADPGETIRVTVSIGVATLCPTDRNLDELLSRADIALYEAKHAGRDRVAAHDSAPTS